MNLTLSSDRHVDVIVHMIFVGNVAWSTKVRLGGLKSAGVTVVGRWPQDLVKLELEHSGMRYCYPIEVDGSGQHLKEIKIFGGRDHWSQLLRNKAMEEPDD